ncbi:MAG: hypothetical protein ACMZ63_10500 [Methylotenera sp.]
MQHNLKIKHAVTAALSIMAFSVHSPCFALGLSDITVQSNLGEPFKAHLNILGADDLKDTSCLRLGPDSNVSNVDFAVNPAKGNIAKLSLSTNQIVNEPIVNLSIIAGCSNSIRRDFVLLLDPPTFNPVAVIDTPNIVGNIDTNVKSSTNNTGADEQKVVPTEKKEKKKAITSKKKYAHNNKKPVPVTAEKSTGVESVAANTKIQSIDTQPRLSISGTSYSTNLAGLTKLRLDKELRFNPDLMPITMNESVAIEDEVTVMNKRLAHLQEQITVLQKQNLKLQSENKMKTAQLTKTESAFSMNGVLPLFGAGLFLFGGYTVYNWLRRRESLIQTHNTEAIWIHSNKREKEHTDELSVENDALFNEVDFDIKDSFEDNQLIPNSMESTFESTKASEENILIEDDQAFSVLDHADVFLSHGRSSLAIQLLQNHLLEFPKQSVTIWLFLLDLLAKENLQKLYEETAEECKLHFNIKIDDFTKIDSPSNESLEDFPHLASGLEAVWNTPAAVTYLEDLIYNNRLEPRAGLAKNLIEELVLLRSIAQDNVSSAQVIQLDQKKVAINEQKEAMLEARKTEKMKELAEAERIAREKAEAEKNETAFEFTLVEKY